MLKTTRFAGLTLASSMLAACSVGADFTPPDPMLPPTSFEGSGNAGAASTTAVAATPLPDANPDWWAVFHDPILTQLESRVATENLDVRTATIRIAESRFQRGVTAAAELPSVSGDGRYQRELYSSNGLLSLVDGLLKAIAPGTSFLNQPFNDFTVGTDASWQLDIWGGVRRQIESAEAQIEASEDQRRDAMVSSLAELASDYLQLRGTQTLLQIADENLKIEQDILQLTKDRQQKGLTTGLDVESAAAQVEDVRAQLPSLEQQEAQEINAISLLLDMPPNALRGALGHARPVSPTPARVPVGIPSELARRRPDIRQAEARLHAATADIGVAVAAFYPNVQLNGTIGFDALNLNNLLMPSSLQYTVGPSITIPIFEGGKLKSTLELRKAQQQEAALAYHKTVLQAWHEVVDALVAHRAEQERRARLALEVGHSRQALTLARSRYNDGVVDLTTVLDAERTLLQAAQQYAQSTTNVSLDLIRLYKALGGGWEQAYPAVQPLAAAAAAD
jgi:NodT family efflux transporter outer membrane factor (OMF) lipoprotein